MRLIEATERELAALAKRGQILELNKLFLDAEASLHPSSFLTPPVPSSNSFFSLARNTIFINIILSSVMDGFAFYEMHT